MIRNLCCSLSALLALGAAAAGPAPPPGEPSVAVRLSDLDLTSRAGAKAALRRIRDAAREVCGDESDVRLLGRQALYRACVQSAAERAAAASRSPLLIALSGG